MPIPQIIHQTWKDEQIPQPMRALATSWKRNHPDWEYRLWTEEENREFIQTHYPEFLTRYDAYIYPIQRVDAVRYFLLYTFGGLYIDLDFECFHSLEPLLSGHECLFGLEPQAHCEIHHRERIIGNALMATAPEHPFFQVIIEELVSSDAPQEHRNNLILETTGPFMLTRVYNHFQPRDVTLLPSKYFYPLSLYEIEGAIQRGWSEADYEKLRDACAIHYFSGTWWKLPAGLNKETLYREESDREITSSLSNR